MLHARGAHEKIDFSAPGNDWPRFSAPRHTAEPSWTLFLASRGIFRDSPGAPRTRPAGGLLNSGRHRVLQSCPRRIPETLLGQFWMLRISPRNDFWSISLSVASSVAACQSKVSTEDFTTAGLPRQGFHRRLCYSTLATTRFP